MDEENKCGLPEKVQKNFEGNIATGIYILCVITHYIQILEFFLFVLKFTVPWMASTRMRTLLLSAFPSVHLSQNLVHSITLIHF